MNKIRKIDQIFQAKPTLEGAGVHLKRVFGHAEVPTFDPFLLLDDFHSGQSRLLHERIPLASPSRDRDRDLHDRGKNSTHMFFSTSKS